MKTRAQALVEEAEHHEKMAAILRRRAAVEEVGRLDECLPSPTSNENASITD